jgi:hypothetical protein
MYIFTGILGECFCVCVCLARKTGYQRGVTVCCGKEMELHKLHTGATLHFVLVIISQLVLSLILR